jgi:hypothetical protein
MRIRRGAGVALLGGLIAAVVFGIAPAASAFDASELPLSIDAANTYSADPIPAVNNDGNHDFAVGGGQHGTNGVPDCSNSTSDCVNEGFSAQSGPLGEKPSGHVSATFMTPNPFKLRGPVLCLDVHLNEAWILVMQQADAAAAGFPAGQAFLLHVIDNGNPVMGTPPDAIQNVGPGQFVPGGVMPGFPCGFFPDAVPLQKGNITVRDADNMP